MMKVVAHDDDIIELNVGGTLMTTSRSTLCQAEGSLLAAMFSGRWEEQLKRDKNGAIFLDMDPYCMSELIAYLRLLSLAGPGQIKPPNIDENKKEHWRLLLTYLGLYDFIYGSTSGLKSLKAGYVPGQTLFRFTLADRRMTISDGDGQVTSTSQGHKAVVAEPALDRTVLWRVKVLCLGGHWMMLGVNSRLSPDDAFNGDSTYGWAGNSQSYRPCFHREPGWKGFQNGDEVVMKLDMEASALFMHVPRLTKTFRMDLPARPAWYIYADLYNHGDSVVLSPAVSYDISLFD